MNGGTARSDIFCRFRAHEGYIKNSGISRRLCRKKGKVMRVGIVTIYDLTNYGNRLQNYATVTYLRRHGIEADTLVVRERSFAGDLKNVYHRFFGGSSYVPWDLRQETREYADSLKPLLRARYDRFLAFSRQYTHLRHVSYRKEIRGSLNRAYDYFIAGSDQLWNPDMGHAQPPQFLAFAKPRKCLSWAASFGVDEIRYRRDEVVRGLRHIPVISVREESAEKIVWELTGKEAEVLIDPTLMLGPDAWDEIASLPEGFDPDTPYLLTYFIGGRSAETDRQIRAIANSHGLAVRHMLSEDEPELYSAGPGEFAGLIKHASLIMTDSFHASVFSILYGRPFLVFRRKGFGGELMGRIGTLLRTFHLEDRYAGSGIPDRVMDCDFAEAYSILARQREKTDAFLGRALRTDVFI